MILVTLKGKLITVEFGNKAKVKDIQLRANVSVTYVKKVG